MRLSVSLDFAAAREDPAAQDAIASDTTAPAVRMDAAAFQVFYAKTAPGLRGYIRRSAGNEALADDILQESCLRLLRAELPALEDAPLKAYLYKIAASLLVDHWRRVKRERSWSLRNFLGGEPATKPPGGCEALRFFPPVFCPLSAQEIEPKNTPLNFRHPFMPDSRFFLEKKKNPHYATIVRTF